MDTNSRETWGNPDDIRHEVRVNPYKLFGITPDTSFTRTQLRNRMRKLVLVTHPDRPSGSPQKFRIVMGCYEHLLKILDEREKTTKPVTDQTVRQYETSRDDERTAYEIPDINARRFGVKSQTNNSSDKNSNFDSGAFNKFFEENRLDDTLQRGHGNWLKKSEDEDDYETRHHRKVGKGQFQEAFEQERKRLLAKKQIVKHTGVIGMSIGKSSIASTDIDDIGMLSNQNAGTMKCSNGVMGVDLREALEVGVLGINPDDHTMSDRFAGKVSMEEARRLRSSARMDFTESEKQQYLRQQEQEQRKEQERIKRVQEREKQIHMHFQRINRMITDQ